MNRSYDRPEDAQSRKSPPSITLGKRQFIKATAGGMLITGATGVTSATTDGDIQINNITVPSTGQAGDPVTVSVSVTNLNQTELRTASLEYRIHGNTRGAVERTLDPNEQNRVIDFPEMTVPSGLAPGTYTQGVYFAGTNKGTTQDFTVLGPVFTASNFQAPASGNVGQTITATVTIKNTGNATGTRTIRYKIADSVVKSESKTLAGGDSVEMTLSGTIPQMSAGPKTQGIYFDDENTPSVSSTITIGPTSPEFRVNSISPSRSSGRVGQSISVDAEVQNTGTGSGSTRFEYRLGGQRIDRTSELTLEPGATRTINLGGEVPDLAAGTYRQGVFVGTSNVGLDAKFVVESNEADFRLETFDAPSRAAAGSTVSARTRVSNTGGRRGTETLRYRIDGTTVDERDVRLDAGESKRVSFEGTVPDRKPGRYDQEVQIRGTDRRLIAQIRIDEPEVAVFNISDLQAPLEAEGGSNIVVRATVRNAGGRSGSTDLEYRIDGQRIARQTVELRAGNSTTVRFEGRVPELPRGTYTQGVFVGSSTRGQTSTLRIRERPRFVLSGLNVNPSATVGDRIGAEVTVRNRGESSATRSVVYRIGKREVASRELQLGADDSRTITLDGEVPGLAPGIYTQGVYVEQESITAALQVLARPPPGEPRFTVSNLQSPASGQAGDEITVNVTVTNTGTAAGETEVQYRFGSEIRATQTIDLDASDAKNIVFTTTVPYSEPRTYRHGVFISDTDRGQTSSFVIEPTPTPTPTPTPSPTRTESPPLPGFGPIAGIAGITGAAYLLKKLGVASDQSRE